MNFSFYDNDTNNKRTNKNNVVIELLRTKGLQGHLYYKSYPATVIYFQKKMDNY